MKRIALALVLALTSLAAFAAGIDGKWTGSIDTPDGTIPLTYEFKVKGTELTGSSLGPDGSPIPVQNGKVDGNRISFSQTLNFGPEPVTLDYTGEVAGDELTIRSLIMGQTFEFKLKKS